MNKKFGDLVKQYRGNKTLKELGYEIGITAAYLSDIEKGNRFPSKRVLDKFIDIFKLDGEEKNIFYDTVAKESPNNYEVSSDIAEYIMENEMLRKFIRVAQKKNVDKLFWNRITKELELGE